MWEAEWSTYLRWKEEILQRTWELSHPPAAQVPSKDRCETLDEFMTKYMGRENEFTRGAFRRLNPQLPQERLHAIFRTMGIGQQHWAEAIRLVKQRGTALPNNFMDTS